MLLSVRRRWLVMLIWLACFAAGLAVIARAQFSADLSAFLPQSPDARQQVLIDQLQSGVAARTLLAGIEGGEGSAGALQRANASRALATGMRNGGLFEQVQNGDTSDWAFAGQWLFENRYLLSPEVTPARFTEQGLREAIGETIALLGTPAGNAMKPLLERDPTGETQRIAEGLIPADAPRSENGVWVSRTSPRALLLATTTAPGADLDAQAHAIAQIHVLFAPFAVQGLSLQLSGSPVFSVQSRDQIKTEASRLAIAGGLVMSALLLLAFASPKALLVAMLPVATGVVAGTAAVSLVFGTVHGLTMGFGSTLIGETVDYAIYYLIQARGPNSAGTANMVGTGWIRWRQQHWPTVRLGLLTSVCGFAALVFSGFPGLAQLGVFSLAGLVAAAIATRFVLPVLAPDGAAGKGLRTHMARVAGGIVHSMPRLRLVFVLSGLAAIGLVIWQGAGLWRSDLAAMSPVPASALAVDADLRNDLGASDARILVIAQANDEQAALQRAEAAGLRLDMLVNNGVLAGYETVSRILPSHATQNIRLASLPPSTALRIDLQKALQGQPLAASRLEPFIADVAAAASAPTALINRRDLAAGPLSALVGGLFFQRPSGGWSAMMALHPGPAFNKNTLVASLAGLHDVQVIDVKDELDGLYAHYLHEAFIQVALGALAVVMLLGIFLRSGRRLLAVCQPLALSVLLVLGGMAALNVPLGILHLVGLLLVVAVGSNYALFFDQFQLTGQADESTLASLLLANLTTVVSFGLIAVSDIPALSAIGRVVAPGALLALLLAAAFTGKPRHSAVV